MALQTVSELCAGQLNVAPILPHCWCVSNSFTDRLATSDQRPWLWWFLQVRLFFVSDNCQAVRKLSIRKDVEATFDLLISMFIRLPPECHLLKSSDLSLAFLTSQVIRGVPDLVAFLFVIVAQFFFDQAFLILYLHVDWIVH